MSSPFNASVIERDLAAKRARLAALKQQRLERQATLERVTTMNLEELRQQYAPDIDISLPAVGDAASAATSAAPSLDVSLNDSLNDSIAREDAAATAGATNGMSNGAANALSPSGMSVPRPGSLRLSRAGSGLVAPEQLQAIQASLEELRESAADAERRTAAGRKRMSLCAPGAGGFLPPRSPTMAGVSEAQSESETEEGEDVPANAAAAAIAAVPHQPIPVTTAATAAPAFSTEASDADRIAELQAQVAHLKEVILSKQADLAVAGDLGSMLLQHNEEATRKIDELSSALEAQGAELLATRHESRANERAMRTLQHHVAQLQSQLAEAEGEVDVVRSELELERGNARAIEAELARAKEQAQGDALASLQAELAESHATREQLEESLAEQRRAAASNEESLRHLREEVEQLTAELTAAAAHEERANELAAELTALKAHDTVNVLSELQWDNQQLTDAMQQLTVHYEHLQESNARDQTLLRALQQKNQSLERELAEFRLGTHRTPKRFESLADDEVLDDGLPPVSEEPDASQPEAQASEAATLPPPELAAAESATAVTEPFHAPSPVHAAVSESTQTSPLPDASALLPLRTPPPAATSAAESSASPAPTPSPAPVASATPRTPARVELDDESVRIATALASSAALGAKYSASGSKLIPSSLASGTASLAFAGLNSTPPRRPSLSVLSAHSPATSGGGKRQSISGGVLGFMSNLLPGSSSPPSGPSRLPRERTVSHPLDGVDSPSSAAGATRASSASSRCSGVWDDSANTAASPRNSSHASSFSGRRVGERDSDREFFALTLLCVKIHSARKCEALYNVSTQDLWNRAKAEGVQFHSYYQWLDQALQQAYVKQLAQDRDAAPGGSPMHTEGASINTAAIRRQLRTPVANAPSLPGAAPAVRVLQAHGENDEQATATTAGAGAEQQQHQRMTSDEFEHIALTPIKADAPAR